MGLIALGLVLAITVGVGLLTRGWFMRMCGWGWLAFGAMPLIAAPTDPAHRTKMVVEGIASVVLGVTLLIAGHWVFYRYAGYYKSRVARHVIATRAMLAGIRHDAHAHHVRRQSRRAARAAVTQPK